MGIINNIKKNEKILLVIAFLYLLLFSLFSKHYNKDDNFSGTLKIVNPIIQFTLLTLMMISWDLDLIFQMIKSMVNVDVVPV